MATGTGSSRAREALAKLHTSASDLGRVEDTANLASNNAVASSSTPPRGPWSTSQYTHYPKNLIRTEVYSHGLESYCKKLESDDYFAKRRSLFLWDLVNSNTDFTFSPNMTTTDELEKYIGTRPKEPFWRFIFLSAGSSRSPLGCNREQLKLLLTHHQVMATFLDFIFAFKVRERPLTQAFFRQENHLEDEEPAGKAHGMSRGLMPIQHAFLVLSVERSEGQMQLWPLRQTVLYHSFDVHDGRSVWIVLKGSVSMRRRIVAAQQSHQDLQPAAMTSTARSFVATLHIHILVLEWCAENWGEYIDYLEEKRVKKAIEVKVAPIAEMTSPSNIAQSLKRKDTFDTTFSQQSTFYGRDSRSRASTSSPTSPFSRGFGRSFSGFLRRCSDLTSPGANGVPEEAVEEDPQDQEEDNAEDSAEELEVKFSFEEAQRLSLLSDELDRAITAVEQNKRILAEIDAQYREIVDSPAFEAHVDRGECKRGVSTFFRRLRCIIGELDVHHVRLKALARAVDNDKEMFDAVLQYKSAKTSEYFAASAKFSSDKMEKWTEQMHSIAVKTAQETVSMHVITIFTLIFLPGTFIAVRLLAPPSLFQRPLTAALTWAQTFFSSGVLNWNDQGMLDSDWVFRSKALRLFLAICLPMMAIIIAGWMFMYWLVRRRNPGPSTDKQDMAVAEKGLLPLVTASGLRG
ncbi:hypothetical protein F4780DRAFT_360551 [Xylariomycetidae sp. FL0641]|nr:hypothetical protein F4780DRAFT_360551 [Xylariomycetidae sp. FL0641]